MPPTDAAKTITRHRERLHWSKRRLAREAELSPAYIVQMENGERPVTERALARIADAVGLHPYVLLGEAGFIDTPHVEEAERMAAEAMKVPGMVDRARSGDTGGKLAWLVADYLALLGDDPYGVGADATPLVDCDWSTIAPERWKAIADGSVRAKTTAQITAEVNEWLAARGQAPTAIEGWNELTDTQRALVQQLVNQFRRSADGQ